MPAVHLRLIDVSFSYNTTSEKIVSGLTIHFHRGWTGIVGPNGAGKTTIAKLATGFLKPTRGSISGLHALSAVAYCNQEVEDPPEHSDDFLYSANNRSGELRSLLGIRNDWLDRWDTLSQGEKKRFQVGASLWLEPEILVLDEPTNHLDSFAQKLVYGALKTYTGTGILISHDRELLDSLCVATLFVRPGITIMRPGGITDGLEQEKMQNKSRLHEHELAINEYNRIKKSLLSLKQKENRKENSLSKKNIDRYDSDSKGKIDLARLTGKDKIGSRKVKLLENRADLLKSNADSKYVTKRKIEGFLYTGETHKGNSIAIIPSAKIPMGGNQYLEIPELTILPTDRIGITGNNGVGKSTLLHYIRTQIKLPNKKVIYINQEVTKEDWRAIDHEIKNLSGEDKGLLLSVIHRLGSEPDRVLKTPMPSPGEVRKLIFGLGLLKTPSLIMMDEPTNHMDLPSVQCLEEALSLFKSAIIMISHDRRFIDQMTNTEWQLKKENKNSRLIIKMK